MKYKKYRVITLNVTDPLPPIGPYFCPNICCNHLALSSVELMYHLWEHENQVLSQEKMSALCDNIHTQIALFAESEMNDLEM